MTVNPSFHNTDIVANIDEHTDNMWQNLDPKLKEEYGEEFFEKTIKRGTKIAKKRKSI